MHLVVGHVYMKLLYFFSCKPFFQKKIQSGQGKCQGYRPGSGIGSLGRLRIHDVLVDEGGVAMAKGIVAEFEVVGFKHENTFLTL